MAEYTALRQLQSEASVVAKIRGHRLEWKMVDTEWMRGTCKFCGREVDVKTNPAPNDIDIGGEAVALNCQSN